MNIAIIGGAGFIGTNLAKQLSLDLNNHITILDSCEGFFQDIRDLHKENIDFKLMDFAFSSNFNEQIRKQDIVYHLASTNIPGTSNRNISEELELNVVVTAKLLDACVKQSVKKIVFLSSGGAVYGKKGVCPIKEDTVTYPISSYGIQKVAIEKLLYLYKYQKGLDYRIIRLANPYGPYQRPNGQLGVVTTFVYKAITDGMLKVYGDGSVIRDFIYIDDAIRGIIKIVNGQCEYRVFNLGSGIGTSVNEVIEVIRRNLNRNIEVEYISSRAADVPENYLDVSRYEKYYGKLNPISLKDGIMKTAAFIHEYFKI